MKPAPIPQDDAKRLEELHRLKVLDSEIDSDLQNLVELASSYLGCPISLISLVDKKRQWFKAKKGLLAAETPRDISFCGHAIIGDEVFIVEDASQDDDFHDNPLVTEDPSIRFYAGAPLKTTSGHRIGTLCLIDQKPRTLTEKEEKFLAGLARQATSLIELKYKENKLEETLRSLEKEKEINAYFIHHLIHDIRNPLNAILMASEIIKRKLSDAKLLSWIEKSILSTRRVNNLASDLINLGDLYAGETIKLNLEEEDLREALAGPLADIGAFFSNRLEVELEDGNYVGTFDTQAILRACDNLITNGIKLGEPLENVLLTMKPGNESIEISIFTKGEQKSIDQKQIGPTSRDMRITISRGLIFAHGGEFDILETKENCQYRLKIPRRSNLLNLQC